MTRKAAAALDRGIRSAASPRESVPAAPAGAGTSKYTVDLDGEMTERFDRLVTDARRRSGKRLRRAALFRAMLRVLDDDQTIRDLVLDEAAAEKSRDTVSP